MCLSLANKFQSMDMAMQKSGILGTCQRPTISWIWVSKLENGQNTWFGKANHVSNENDVSTECWIRINTLHCPNLGVGHVSFRSYDGCCHEERRRWDSWDGSIYIYIFVNHQWLGPLLNDFWIRTTDVLFCTLNFPFNCFMATSSFLRCDRVTVKSV